MANRKAFIALVGMAAGVAGVIYAFGTGLNVGLPAAPAILAREPVDITIASAITKQRWLEAAAADFLATGAETSKGRPIRIDVTNVLSGDSMLQILGGSLKPTVWSPGESVWVDQFNDRWALDNPRPAMSAPCASTVLAPVGFAMWQPMARALGWPDKPVGWKTLTELARNPDGWGAYGHPEWGKLKLGHTHPQYSNAGLLFLASAIYAEVGKSEGLTTDEVYSPPVEAMLADLARNTAKYGMVTTDLLTKMADYGPEFLHVTSAFEEGAVRFNVERREDLRWPLAFIFPAEGTFWTDQPYCVLDQASWVTPEQAEAAKLFLDYLRSNAAQKRAGEFFLRPVDPKTPIGGALSVENGTNPTASPATVPAQSIPGPEVSEAIMDQFMVTKRKATVMLVLDVSGSMQGEPIVAATAATQEFISRLDPNDEVGLVTFSDRVAMHVPVTTLSSVAETLVQRVDGLIASGGTNLNGAICYAAKNMRQIQEDDTQKGENRLYALVLLSDGKDNKGVVTETRMLQDCLSVGAESEPVKVFSIAFGNEADTAVLERIAKETTGGVFKADPDSISAAYLRISAEQ